MHCRYELKNKGSPNRNISITFVSGFCVEFLLTIQIMRQYANLSYILLQLNSFSVLEMMDTIDEFLIKYILDIFSFLEIFKSYIKLLQFLRIHAYESCVIEKLSFFLKGTNKTVQNVNIYLLLLDSCRCI